MAPRQRILNSSRGSCEYESSENVTSLQDQRKISRKPSTLNQTEADIARDRHDYFNLISLLFIIGTSAMNYESNLAKFTLQYHGNYFWLNWATTYAYFMADLIWVAVVPICVKSPRVIIQHHSVAMFFLLAPVFYPEYRWFVGTVLSVEINTWFLILRRVVFKTSSGKPVSPWIGLPISAMFYFTWIVIRCIVYPAVLITFLGLAKEKIDNSGNLFHLPMIFIPCHAALCVLNFMWSYDLFKPIVRQWLGIGPKTVVVQNGL
eukprot:Nitzschia sp. Nitz4//scaffold213_size37731//27729//28766//NITZ4_007724-RA/size37731-augustus-gene-0.53-mRNA-1//-1//CDS//3329542077//1348//frame0